MVIFLVVTLLIAILAVIFALQNPAPVTVTFLAWKFESSLALVLLLAFVLGVIVTLVILIPNLLRSRWTISSQKKKIKELEKNVQKNTEVLKPPAEQS